MNKFCDLINLRRKCGRKNETIVKASNPRDRAFLKVEKKKGKVPFNIRDRLYTVKEHAFKGKVPMSARANLLWLLVLKKKSSRILSEPPPQPN